MATGRPVLGGGFVERVVEALAEEAGGAAGHEDLDEAFVRGAAVDLARGGGGIGVVDDDGAAKAGRVGEPAVGEVLVVGGGDGVAPIKIGMDGETEDVGAGEDGGLDAVAVEVVGQHERGVAAGHAARRRAGVFALDADRRDVAGGGTTMPWASA